jgi:hypothetical protein
MGNAGTIHGATRTSSGKSGNALSFDGTSYVSIADSASLRLSKGMTLAAWVRPTVVDKKSRGAISKESSSGVDYALYSSDTSGKVAGRVRVGSASGVTTGALRVNTWSHLSVTFDGTVLRLYVNGVLANSKSLSGSLAAGGGQLRLGSGFRGVIDDVRVWNKALTASAIKSDAGIVTATTTRNRSTKLKRSGR